MKKVFPTLFLTYTLLVDLLLFLLLVFFGVLADENVKFEKFAKAYTFSFEYNYNFLMSYLAFIFGLTLFLQAIIIFNLIKKDIIN